MRQKKRSRISIAACMIFNVVTFASYSQVSVNPNNPSISQVSPVLNVNRPIAPDVFLMLDDSGSMTLPMVYDPNSKYRIPPDPNGYNPESSKFADYKIPTGNQNGYAENGVNIPFVFTPGGRRRGGPSYVGHCYMIDYNTQNQVNSSSYAGSTSWDLSNGLYYVYQPDLNGTLYAPFVYFSYQIYDAPDSDSNNCKTFKAFYGTRMLALKSSLAIALNDEKGNYKTDFDFINNPAFDSISLLDMDRSKPTFGKNMKVFLDGLYQENAISVTPVRQQTFNLYERIRKLAKSKSVDNIFLTDDATSYDKEKLLACKQTYSIILSDGEYNSSLAGAGTDMDYDSRLLPKKKWQKCKEGSKEEPCETVDVGIKFDGTGKTRIQRLFAGGSPSLTNGPSGDLLAADRLSDITFQAWEQDLNSEIDDRVSPRIKSIGPRQLKDSEGNVLATLPEVWNPENDPANWQRIISYTVGLGIGEEWTDQSMAAVINGTSTDVTPGWYGVQTWNDNVVSDFVRAGYVGRGGFKRADSPDDLVKTFKDIFAEAIRNSGTNAASGSASSTSQITSKSTGIVFFAEVDPGSRTGNLKGHWMYSGVNKDNPKTTDYVEGERIGDAKKCYDVTETNSDGSVKLPSSAFAGQLCTSKDSTWSAIHKMPMWNSRNIVSYNPESQTGINFSYKDMSDSQKKYINDMFGKPNIESILKDEDYIHTEKKKRIFVGYDWEWKRGKGWVEVPVYKNKVVRTKTDKLDITVGTANKIVNFIRGDNTLANDDSVSDIRKRPDGAGSNGTPLGDFGRGGPHFLGVPNNRIWKKSSLSMAEKNRAVAFAGANDGMLHAFNANNGVELFAYIPNAVYKNLHKLVLPKQAHTAFVDGQISTQDIDGEKTILVSGMGAGAKGLFALDVTDPSSFTKDNVLWEIDEKSDHRLGRIFGKPSIIRVEGTYKGKKNRWVVAVGTGYNNNSEYKNDKGDELVNTENGVLVLDALTGDVIDFLALPGAQGVGEITWVDHQKHKKVGEFSTYFATDSLWGEMDRGYVGDLLGNVWVLDFAEDLTKTQLKSAIIADKSNDVKRLDSDKIKAPKPSSIPENGPAPLFIATDEDGNRQPITAQIIALSHPSNRGYMLYFGTGELFKTTPLQKNTSNSLYGVWDDIGDNYGDISTVNVVDNNRTRDRFYLAHYPWKTVTTTFVDGTSAYARVPKSDRKGIKWANIANEDSISVNPHNDESKASSSGWVVNTGKNDDIPQFERVFQPAYTVLNEAGEEGITYLMHTVKTDADPCNNDASAYTWSMTFRTDIIDGPLATFSSALNDSNGDGVIDESDEITYKGTSGLDSIPLGAIASKFGDKRGNSILEYVPTTVQSPKGRGLKPDSGAGDFCSGTTRSYKKVLSESDEQGSIMKEINVCIPRTMSSWSEVE